MEVPAENPLLAALTDTEISRLIATHKNGMGETLRRCALGILQSGQNIDNTEELLRQYPDFQFGLEPNVQGIKFVLRNAPQTAFQQFHERGETRLHEFMREHLCAVVRDLVYQLMNFGHPQTTQEITDAIFRMLREVGVFTQTAKDRNGSPIEMNRVVAWGGHSIDHEEYAYGKLVGSAVAKQLCEFITGCGPGAMRAPFSGSIAAYHEERITNARHFGFTSPGIITSEPPNKFVNPLVILPDIEKRLEAFIRGSIGGIIFPGGVGTAEEIQTILSILIHPKNNNQQYPLIFTGPEKSRSYFAAIDAFLKETIGEEVCGKYDIIIDDPDAVAQALMKKIIQAKKLRAAMGNSNLWYRSLYFPEEVQHPFMPTHEAVQDINLQKGQEPYLLAAQMRRLFSAIVYGNVTDDGTKMIRERGPFIFKGDTELVGALDSLLRRFVAEGRMKIEGDYVPCYELKKEAAESTS